MSVVTTYSPSALQMEMCDRSVPINLLVLFVCVHDNLKIMSHLWDERKGLEKGRGGENEIMSISCFIYELPKMPSDS